jgi:hypothetical protein
MPSEQKGAYGGDLALSVSSYGVQASAAAAYVKTP